jgi:uncharacterized membrane protein
VISLSDTERRPKFVDFHLGLMSRLRAYFLAGILVTAPIGLTVYLSWLLVHTVDQAVEPLIPAQYNPDTYMPFGIPGLGLLVVVVMLTLIGALTAGFVGRTLIALGEGFVARMPVVRTLYSSLKQIFETILADRATVFRHVVLIEFPRTGLWRLGFVTGTTRGKTQTVVPGGLVNVFIPGTPNIAAGFLVMAPAAELIDMDLTPEEALKLVVSGGIATPPPRPDEPPSSPTEPV